MATLLTRMSQIVRALVRMGPYWEECLISITENLSPQQSIRSLLQTFRTSESGLAYFKKGN